MTLLVVAIAAAFVGLPIGAVLLARHLDRRAQPVNMVGGLVLPSPHDLRWTPGRQVMYVLAGWAPSWWLGRLQVIGDHWIKIDGVKISGSARYARAVMRAQVERRALEAVEGEQ